MAASPTSDAVISPAPPRLDLPWMQALLAARADLTVPDATDPGPAAQDANAVHYIRCGDDAASKAAGEDFLTAVSKARLLVAAGARRIVFLTADHTKSSPLHTSLISFSRHAGRAMSTRPTEFVVIPFKAERFG